MQQAWDKNGRIYYIDDNGNRVQPKSTLNAFQKLQRQAQAKLGNLQRWLENSDVNSQSYKDKANLTLGLLTAPIGGSSVLASKGAAALTPMVGKKIAQSVASNAVGGATGGAVEGFGRGLIEQKNPIKTAVQDGTIGLVTGGALGGVVGKIGQAFAKRGLPNNPAAQQQYFTDYVEGLSNNTPINKVSRFQKALGDFKIAREGASAGGKNSLFDLISGELPQIDTPAFKNWSGDTPMVSSKEALDYPFKTGQGVTVEGYHGTKRGDRVGAEFKKERATSGPMAFFSSDKDIATNYSKGKEDTSLSEEMMDYWQWFKYRDKNGNLKPLGDAWWDLSSDERWAVAKNAPHISFDDEVNNIIFDAANNRGVGNYDYALKQYRNNPLKALIDGWLEGGSLYGREDDFLKVLEKAGVNMGNIDYIDPYTDHSKVYDVYLSMKKPLVTNDIPNELVERLSAEAPNNPAKYQDGYGVDLWDKNRRDGVEWVNELKNDIAAGENSHAWTSIPDWVTEEMKKQGYDGIIDMGGKGGGEIHKVYIPFEPTQIKSVNNQGTFDPTNPNIYKTIAPFGTIPLFNLLKQDNNQ